MTPEQIRARLKAAGYPENFLDAYMGATGATGTAPVSDTVFNAVRALGLVDAQGAAAAAAGAKAAEPVAGPERGVAAARSRIFGLDVFRRSTSQFEPSLAGPVDANYRVGPRDVLAVILTGGVEASYSLEVTREGFIVVPSIGQVYIANMTLEQVDRILFDRLKRVYSGLGRAGDAPTRFYVTVSRLRANQVFVIGEAQAPGSYQVSSVGTMLTALYGAGGPGDNGSLRNIELRREGKSVSTLDVYDYLLNGDASRDARLQTGDVLFVPIHGPRVEIAGAVIRPSIYELKSNETLRDLIRMSGGFANYAGRRRVLVRRVIPPTQRTEEGGRDRTVLDVASSEFATGFGPEFPLVDGDIVEVSSVPDRVRNEIDVQGAVWSPGKRGFSAGMRLSDALRAAGGVRPDVKDVLIDRLQSDQTRLQLRAAFTDTLGHLVNDIPLQEDDRVRVYSTSEFRPDRYVAIAGAVNKPGRYPWQEGMTAKDLVHLAGGLDDGAYLVEAEIARLPENRAPGQLARTVKVPLDSTYLLERTLDGKYVGPPGLLPTTPRAPEVELEPYDNMLILRQPDWQLERRVLLVGEVTFPGYYTLLTKQDRLKDLVMRAGGLTPRAYPAGAVFTRPSSELGRVGLDLTRALKDPSYKDNLVLLAGDTLYVPAYQPTVKIEGAVHSQIAVAYVPGKKLDYYIDAAGGPTFTADRNRAFVRQPNGIVDPYKNHWLIGTDHNPTPQPGAVVIVPAKDPNDKKDWTAIAGSIAQIVVGAVAIIAVVSK